jgi:hypothetical protein
MTTPADRDEQLESLQEELRASIAALNDMLHPVYPANPARVAELEGHVAELHDSILARRRELRIQPVHQPATPAATAAKGP